VQIGAGGYRPVVLGRAAAAARPDFWVVVTAGGLLHLSPGGFADLDEFALRPLRTSNTASPRSRMRAAIVSSSLGLGPGGSAAPGEVDNGCEDDRDESRAGTWGNFARIACLKGEFQNGNCIVEWDTQERVFAEDLDPGNVVARASGQP
jgi:hypothetical protein